MITIKTYQDLMEVRANEKETIDFCLDAIKEHEASEDFKIAALAEEYDRKRNPTIRHYKKMLTTMLGTKVEDIWSVNHKIVSGFFNRFITQENSMLLSNGLFLNDSKNKKKLGFDIDSRLMEMGRNALVQKVSFGFYDKDHLRVFKFTEFVPLFDEENGAIRAGVRFWRIDSTKPLRFTLYEEDGFTEYIKREDKEPGILQEKRKYIQIIQKTEVDGTEIYAEENYPGFPVVPMYGNLHHQSELVGIKDAIDCYDFIKSGFANVVDESSEIYWILKNSGGSDEKDLAIFLERMRTIRAAVVDAEEGGEVESHTITIPYEAREKILERLENDLYKDFMALDVKQISAGNVTATQIMASYDPLNQKVDGFESCVIDFLGKLFEIAGIDDEPKFNRSQITNQLEVTQMVMMAAQYLDDETILSKLPWLTQEDIENIKKVKTAEDIERFETEGGGIDAEL